MPFIDRSSAPQARGGAADALAHDVITRLAKLRSLFVIAQGTVFALHERGVGAEEAGRLLNVDYVVSGSTRVRGTRLTVTVELAETRSARIVWTEIFNLTFDDAFVVLDEIGNRIVASIASEIETLERNRAILKPPSSLDAWGAHHRGLWHMHQYRQADNEHARHFFETALRLDPTFSRAYAGLSFTHFHDAFQNWSDRAAGMEQAYRAAAQGLMADERDPAVHWAMGRALMLRGQPDESISALTRSIELSPNFALGHYNLSFVHSIVGDAHAAISAADYSRHLSPFDPMLYGMLATRAMALVRLGRFEEAASWAVKAAARPNAFPHIHAIAACCLALAGSLEQARAHVAAVRHTSPRYAWRTFSRRSPSTLTARHSFAGALDSSDSRERYAGRISKRKTSDWSAPFSTRYLSEICIQTRTVWLSLSDALRSVMAGREPLPRAGPVEGSTRDFWRLSFATTPSARQTTDGTSRMPGQKLPARHQRFESTLVS